MSQFDQADRQPPVSPSRGCFLGASLTVLGGVLLVSFGAVLAFRYLPMLIQGPLDLGEEGAVGQRLPDLKLQPLTGAAEPVTLDSLAGQVVVVNFWGTWCGPCRMELPHIAHLQEVFGSRPDFRLLAVSCSPPGSDQTLDQLRSETEATLRRSKFDMPTYADRGMVTRRAFDSVESFRGYPTTLVMDREGVIRRVWVGFDPGMPDQIESLINQLLAQPQG